MPITTGFDRLLATVLCLTALIYALRCVFGALLYAASVLPGNLGHRARRSAAWVTPILVQRIAVTILGTAIFGGGGLAAAQAADRPPGNAHQGVAIPDLDRGPQLTPRSRTHIVETNDCLWSLAAEQLAVRGRAEPATAAQVDKAWQRWYQLNKPVIGVNPNIIIAGMHLRIPELPGPVEGGVR